MVIFNVDKNKKIVSAVTITDTKKPSFSILIIWTKRCIQHPLISDDLNSSPNFNSRQFTSEQMVYHIRTVS